MAVAASIPVRAVFDQFDVSFIWARTPRPVPTAAWPSTPSPRRLGDQG